MAKKSNPARAKESRPGGRGFFGLAVVALVVAGGLAAQELREARDSRWLSDARTVASPGSFVFDATEASTWTLLARDVPATELARLRVRVRDVDTGDVVETRASEVQGALPAEGGLSPALDVAVATPGRYELTLSGVGNLHLLLVDDVVGHALRARRAMRRAAGVFALGTSAALALLLLGVVVGRSRPRRRATASRRAPAPVRPPMVSATPRPRVPTGLGLQVTPATAGAPAPLARAPTNNGLYRPLPPQRRRSVFEEETEALDAVFMSDIWEVPTAA